MITSAEKCPRCGAFFLKKIEESSLFICGTLSPGESDFRQGKLCLRNQLDQLREQNGDLTKDLQDCEERYTHASEERNELRAEVERLTDLVDLQRDEFMRIKAMDSSPELHNICDRAISKIEQTVPVIVQRDQLESKCRKLESDVERLKAEKDELKQWIELQRIADGATPFHPVGEL